MVKKYKRAFVCGRMNHIHLGHQSLINTALNQAETVLVVIGSAQEANTERNPFSADYRAKLVKIVYPEDNVLVSTLPDMTDENDIRPEWGQYLLEHVRMQFDGENPDLMVYGNDENRNGWFDPKDIQDIEEIQIKRADLPISATRLREYLVQDRYEHWARFVDAKLHPFYSEIREKLAEAKFYWGKVSFPDLPDGTKILFHTKYLQLRYSPKGYTYTHDPWCDSQGVGILPYRISEEYGVEFLVVEDQRPCHSQRSLYAITGGYDNSDRFTLAQCALNELLEEGGYERDLKDLIPLGSTFTSRSSDVEMELFGIRLPIDAPMQIPTGDGSEGEKNMVPCWVSKSLLAYSSDPILSSLYLRLESRMI